jgi:lysophospholipase L1-like esterase
MKFYLPLFILLLRIGNGVAMTQVPLNHSGLKYDGVLYPQISSNEVIFNRHAPLTYDNTESGIYGTWIRQWVNTQTGIRIRFKTSSAQIALHFTSRADGGHVVANPTNGFTVLVDGVILQSFSVLDFTINSPAAGSHVYEVVLPNLWAVNFTGMEISDGATLEDPGALNKPVYVAIGNSITHGTGQYCASSKTYPYLLAQSMGWDLYNLAVAGAGLGWAASLNLKNIQADHISIKIGFNDWKYNAANFVSRQNEYAKLIDSVRKFQPNAHIYCITPIVTTETTGASDYTLDQFRNMVLNTINTRRQAGDLKLHVFKGDSLTQTNMLDDGVHFNEYGANLFASRLASLVGGGNSNSEEPDFTTATSNMAANSGIWTAYTDNLGSTVQSFSNVRPISANFIQVPKTTAEYPWTTLSGNTGSFAAYDFIQVRYKAPQSVQMSLPQPGLSSSGQSYQFVLSASSDFVTVTIPISSFTQPSWASNIQALNLNQVSSIAFTSLIDAAAGGSPSLQIDTLLFLKKKVVTDLQAGKTNSLKLFQNQNNEWEIQGVTEEVELQFLSLTGSILFQSKISSDQMLPNFNFPEGMTLVVIRMNQSVECRKFWSY